MSEPNYFIRYNEYLNSQDDNLENFLSFLTSLSESEWKEFLADLLGNAPYPPFIQGLNQDYSTITYFSIYMDRLKEDVKQKIDKCLDEIANSSLTQSVVTDVQLIINALLISRLLERGVSPQVLIDNIVCNTTLPENLRFEASATLTTYDDIVTRSFWFLLGKDLLKNGHSFLAFPRFAYLQQINPSEAFNSLRYFVKEDYINERDISLPLEDFFFLVLPRVELHGRIKSIFAEIPHWLKGFIVGEVLNQNDFESFAKFLVMPETASTKFVDQVIPNVNEIALAKDVLMEYTKGHSISGPDIMSENMYAITYSLIAMVSNSNDQEVISRSLFARFDEIYERKFHERLRQLNSEYRLIESELLIDGHSYSLIFSQNDFVETMKEFKARATIDRTEAFKTILENHSND